MAETELSVERTSGVEWGQFVIALAMILLTILLAYGANEARITRIETQQQDANPLETARRVQKIEAQVDFLVEREKARADKK